MLVLPRPDGRESTHHEAEGTSPAHGTASQQPLDDGGVRDVRGGGVLYKAVSALLEVAAEAEQHEEGESKCAEPRDAVAARKQGAAHGAEAPHRVVASTR